LFALEHDNTLCTSHNQYNQNRCVYDYLWP